MFDFLKKFFVKETEKGPHEEPVKKAFHQSPEDETYKELQGRVLIESHGGLTSDEVLKYVNTLFDAGVFDRYLESFTELTNDRLDLTAIADEPRLAELLELKKLSSSELSKEKFKPISNLRLHSEKSLEVFNCNWVREVFLSTLKIKEFFNPRILLTPEEIEKEFLGFFVNDTHLPTGESLTGEPNEFRAYTEFVINQILLGEIELPKNLLVVDGSLVDVAHPHDLKLSVTRLVLTFCETDKAWKLMFIIPAQSPACFNAFIKTTRFYGSPVFQQVNKEI